MHGRSRPPTKRTPLQRLAGLHQDAGDLTCDDVRLKAFVNLLHSEASNDLHGHVNLQRAACLSRQLTSVKGHVYVEDLHIFKGPGRRPRCSTQHMLEAPGIVSLTATFCIPPIFIRYTCMQPVAQDYCSIVLDGGAGRARGNCCRRRMRLRTRWKLLGSCP